MENQIRRDFLKLGLGTAGMLMIPAWPGRLLAATEDPHFFLQIVFRGGVDNSYFFDGRPLAFKQANLMQNYLNEEPTLWQGTNGGSCWASRLTQPLAQFRDRFSVINGVVMTAAFDGHLQNVNYLIAGDPFGGESFIPHLNQGPRPDLLNRPLDAVITGNMAADFSNSGRTVPLKPDSARKLAASIRSSTGLSAGSPAFDFIAQRLREASRGAGFFSRGSAAMLSGMELAPALGETLKSIELANPEDPSYEKQFMDLTTQLFKKGAARSAIAVLFPEGEVDAHDVAAARAQPVTLNQIAEKIAVIFRALKETPYDDGRSFFDVTTVMVTSEFGRTMRQMDLPIDATGTDHNAMNNSVLIGGKGIRPGMVIGASDRQTVAEAVSAAHRSMDPSSLKLMGRPFDFANLAPRADLPAEYDPVDYLNIASVVNTIYSLFGIPESKYRITKRNGPRSPVLRGLLT